jgi:Uma2 family endonuclease
VLLPVEVSDTTLRYDLRIKAKLYARAGILEYWVADLNRRRLIVHRQPEQGQYLSVVAYDVDESVTPLAALEHSVPVRNLFP